MMGKKRKSLTTMGSVGNPFKCVKGSACPDNPDKGGECRLWHPPDQHLPEPNQKTDDQRGEVGTHLKVLKGGKAQGYKLQIPCILASLGNADLPISGMPL